MPPLPRSMSRGELIGRFRALGWDGPRPGGKHSFMVKGHLKVRIPNPHGSSDIHVSLLKRILQQAGISADDWMTH